LNKPDIYVGIHAKIEEPKVRVSVSEELGNLKSKPS